MKEEKAPRLRDIKRPAAYAVLLPRLQQVARQYGYALAVHGSMATDLDLIAVAWVEDAKSEEELIQALLEAIDGILFPSLPVEDKPHGRRAYSIYFRPLEGNEQAFPYLDVSVIPPKRREE